MLLLLALADLGSNGFSTQAEMRKEAEEEFERADAQLNDISSKLLAAASDVDTERRRKLIEAERAWLTFRDAEAEFEADDSRGGTFHSTEVAMCLTDLTNERTMELRKILEHGEVFRRQISRRKFASRTKRAGFGDRSLA
jgi:uncharacterized protein YecT (DUF1311 family)